MVACLFSALTSGAQPRKTLPGHLPKLAAPISPLGRVEPTTRLDLAIGLALRNPDGLHDFLQELYDPVSTNFHRYLTPSAFAEKFGPTPDQYQAVLDFARRQGLTVTRTHPGRMLLEVTGSAAEVEQAFQVRLLTFQHPTESRAFRAPDREPTVPAQVPILDISGLDNLSGPRPLLSKIVPLDGPAPPAAEPEWNGSGPYSTYIPQDFQGAYADGITGGGAGQSVGLIEFDGCFQADVFEYAKQENLPRPKLTEVLIAGANGTPGKSNPEVELDVEMAIGIAPSLSQVILYEGPLTVPNYASYFNSVLIRMAEDDAAGQLSSSWNPPSGPNRTRDQIFQQMAAQGQSFFQASGDYGAYTNGVPQMADDPYITLVGGTSLTLNWDSGYPIYGSEAVWNNGTNGVSGGGVSTNYPIPFYQQGVDMSTNGGSIKWRNSPDVAMIADGAYVIFGGGRPGAFGGTSVAAPMWAGYMALVNQQAASNGLPNAGFINPAIYGLGEGTNYDACLHDITSGNNTTAVSPNNYYAEPGYDLCTGWGSPSGQALVNSFILGPNTLGISPINGLAAAGPVGGPFTLNQRQIVLTDGGPVPVTWSLGNVPSWLAVSTNGGTLLPNQPGVAVTCAVSSIASNFPAGNYPAVVIFTNLSDSTEHPWPVSLAVYEFGALQVTITPAAAVQAGAMWNVDGGPWQDSGAILSGLPTTNHVVEFSGITNWAGPASETVRLSAGETNEVMGVYAPQYGSLSVTILPAGACVDGAHWQVDGGPWMNSGDTVSVPATTNHTLSFPIVTGWTKPAKETITVSEGQLTSTNAVYSESFQFTTIVSNFTAPGLISPFFSPQGIAAGTNGNFFVSDARENVVCEVSLHGTSWVANAIVGLDGDPGGDNGTNTIAGFAAPLGLAADAQGHLYVADSGDNAIRQMAQSGTNWMVTTIASNIPAPAGIAVDDYGNLWVTGTTVVNYGGNNPYVCLYFLTNAGGLWNSTTYVSWFDQIGGNAYGVACVPPDFVYTVDGNDVWALVNDGFYGEFLWSLTPVAGTGTSGHADGNIFTAQFASPEGIVADQFGNVFIADTGNGWIREMVPVGFSPPPVFPLYDVFTVAILADNGKSGFEAPAAIAFDSEGNLLVTDKGDGTIKMGATLLRTLQVLVGPENTNLQTASFQVDGGAWSPAGSPVPICLGQHTIGFTPIPGWVTPSNLIVTITSNQSVSASYLPILQSLSVTLGPAAAVSAGATWQLDGGPWQPSGTTLSGLSPGPHQLAFTNIHGWTAPTNTAILLVGLTNAASFGYVATSKTGPGADSVAITSPKPGEIWTNQVFFMTGVAPAYVIYVFYQIDGDGWTQAANTNGWQSPPMVLSPGPHTVQVMENNNGILSVHFDNTPEAPVTLTINGQGTVSPKAGLHYLDVGKTYSFTAIPGKNVAFAGWSGDVVSGNLTLSLTIETNAILQANFVPNPLGPGAGSYQGLFYPPNSIAPPSSGFFSATVSSNGAFSGKLFLENGSSSFSGLFNAAGQSSNYILRAINPIALTMSLDSANHKISGDLQTPNWAATLQACAVAFSKTNPSPYAGAYTVQILPGQGFGLGPAKDGLGSVSVNALGSLTFAGKLGDGSSVSQSAIVSPQGQWPFFANLYSGSGVILGWLDFTNAPVAGLGGTLTWIKTPTTAVSPYASGFFLTNAVQGSVRTNQ